MKNLFPVIGVIVGLILGCAVSLEATERTRPNFVFMFADYGLPMQDLGKRVR